MDTALPPSLPATPPQCSPSFPTGPSTCSGATWRERQGPPCIQHAWSSTLPVLVPLVVPWRSYGAVFLLCIMVMFSAVLCLRACSFSGSRTCPHGLTPHSRPLPHLGALDGGEVRPEELLQVPACACARNRAAVSGKIRGPHTGTPMPLHAGMGMARAVTGTVVRGFRAPPGGRERHGGS